MSEAKATHAYTPGGTAAALEFLKRTRSELRALHRVRLYKDRVHVVDVNKDYFEVCGIGYPDADVVPLLRAVNAAFNPETIHSPTTEEYKELGAGRRYPWAYDRVM